MPLTGGRRAPRRVDQQGHVALDLIMSLRPANHRPQNHMQPASVSVLSTWLSPSHGRRHAGEFNQPPRPSIGTTCARARIALFMTVLGSRTASRAPAILHRLPTVQ